MRRSLKIILAVLILISTVFSMTSCFYLGLTAKNKDLLSVTRASVLGTNGYIFYGIFYLNPLIYIIDEDSYGRVLYGYIENPSTPIIISIMQSSDDEYAYFYPDVSYFLAEYSDDYFDDLTVRGPTEKAFNSALDVFCGESQLESLKRDNDWGLPLSPEKCEKTKIKQARTAMGSFDRVSGSHMYNFEFEDAYAEFLRAEGYPVYDLEHPSPDMHEYTSLHLARFQYCYSDKYGRELYYLEGTLYHYTELIKYEYDLAFAMIVNTDCTYDIERCYVEIPDRLNFREALIHLKENNNWNMPQDSEVTSYEN